MEKNQNIWYAATDDIDGILIFCSLIPHLMSKLNVKRITAIDRKITLVIIKE